MANVAKAITQLTARLERDVCYRRVDLCKAVPAALNISASAAVRLT